MTRRGVLRAGAVAGATAIAAPALTLATGEAAHADLFDPRQDWLRDSLAGLFLHWGLRTLPVYTDVAAFEAAAAGWSADYWVGEARKLHASYLVLTSFHSKMGYLRTWPSAIPGSPATTRDFLGELIRAAKAEDMHVLLYMTDDPQWHAETGFDYFDVASYQRYKNDPTVDITTRDGFGQFSYDNFVEVMRGYPDLSGFWIDNDNDYWLDHGLYELIRSMRPNYLLSNNNEDTPIMDTVSNEQKTGMTPAYDYPQGIWTPAPRLTEADFKLAGNWWYDGKDHTIDYGLNLGRLITCAGASMKALIAEGAQVDGRFPPNYEAFNNFVKSYLDPIAESLEHTEGGGYLYGGLQPGAFNDGGYGATTVSKHDDRHHYVHVLTPPGTDTLRVRDNGYLVVGVDDVRTGQRLAFSQDGGYLTVHGVPAWDRYDTVFRVATAVRQGTYPAKAVTVTATSSASGQPAANLSDGSYLTWWDNGGTLPVSLTLDLRHRELVRYLAVNQREWSPVHPKDASEASARIKDYQVYVSDDGNVWTGPVAAGVLENARAVRFIDLGTAFTRYVRLDVATTWATGTTTKYTNRLLIDELWVGWRYPQQRLR